MQFSIVCSVLVALAVANSATALKCNLCLGSTDSDCSRGVVDSLVTYTCPPYDPNDSNKYGLKLVKEAEIVPVCLEVALFENEAMTPAYERTCIYFMDNEDICKPLAESGLISHCKSCATDLCN